MKLSKNPKRSQKIPIQETGKQMTPLKLESMFICLPPVVAVLPSLADYRQDGGDGDDADDDGDGRH